MIGIDDVFVLQIQRSGLVGQVHGMLLRQVPHGEGFKLGVPRRHAALVLVIQL